METATVKTESSKFIYSEANLAPKGRIGSAVAGSGLFTLAPKDLKKSPVWSICRIGISSFFLYRSVTAYCPLTNSLNKR